MSQHLNSQEENNTREWFSSDMIFDSLYPPHIQRAAQKHWTRLEVAKKVADFVAAPGKKILDIGSGSGKFVLTAAHLYPDTLFYGVEQREELIDLCNDLKDTLHLPNASFIHKNVTDLDFSQFDHFYFYNSFYENIDGTEKIDYSVEYSEKLYDYYNLYVYKQLKKMPAATRIATFHSFGNEIPPGYEIVKSEYDNYLQFWVKI